MIAILLPFLKLYRHHLWLVLLGMLLALIALLAGIGLLALSGWFLCAAALAGTAGLYSFNYLLPAAGVRASAILRTTARYAERLVSHDATFRLLTRLRVHTFSQLLPLFPGRMIDFNQADVLNRLVADVDTLDHLYLRVLSPLCVAGMAILILAIGLGFWDPGLAAALGSILLTLLLALPLFFYRAGKPIGYAITALRSQYRVQLNSFLLGQAELAIFALLDDCRRRLNQLETRWQQRQQQQNALNALAQAILLLASGLTLVLMLWLAAEGVGEHRPPGALLALFVFATLAAFEALNPVVHAFQHLGQVMASAERITQLVTQSPTVTFPSTNQAIFCSSQAGISLEIRNLHFNYPNQPLPVLNNLNLSVAAGEKILLLGQSGAGKSTLLQLLTRAWDPQQGQISLAGHPLSTYSAAALRQHLTVVPQRIYLFSATLRDNLLLSAPSASDEQLLQVLTQVEMAPLFGQEGLNTWMGEGGRQLSGGELRRLGIARALLRQAPLVLLDEPTEGLDPETETHIMQLLVKHFRQTSMILITHRPHYLARPDKTYRLDQGRITEI